MWKSWKKKAPSFRRFWMIFTHTIWSAKPWLLRGMPMGRSPLCFSLSGTQPGPGSLSLPTAGEGTIDPLTEPRGSGTRRRFCGGGGSLTSKKPEPGRSDRSGSAVGPVAERPLLVGGPPLLANIYILYIYTYVHSQLFVCCLACPYRAVCLHNKCLCVYSNSATK